jgi:hypothetical protein
VHRQVDAKDVARDEDLAAQQNSVEEKRSRKEGATADVPPSAG